MRRFVTALLLLAVVAAPAVAKEKVYGKGVAEGDVTSISAVLAHPDQYVGKTLVIEGTVVGVCAHRGCWLSLASDVEGQTLRVKVEDGVIVFPKEIVGEKVRATGVFKANRVEDTAKKCDATRAGEPEVQCKTVYELAATGAVCNWK
ncbi:MAG: DUF4920 domain-containing protein [bacterium]|nr:DUF4920 domain-containing protein [bacterium]